MTTLIEVARQALEALEDLYAEQNAAPLWKRQEHWQAAMDKANTAIPALRTAIEQAEKQDGDCQQCGGQGCVACDARKQEPVEDLAVPSGGLEGGPEEDRIEESFWRFDARHKGYGQWKTAPMSERDAFKAEMRNALDAERTRNAEKRIAPAAPVQEPLVECDCTTKISPCGKKQTHCSSDQMRRAVKEGHAFTTTPPAARRQWVGLTDEDLPAGPSDADVFQPDLWKSGYAAALFDVRAKLREKNGGQA